MTRERDQAGTVKRGNGEGDSISENAIVLPPVVGGLVGDACSSFMTAKRPRQCL